MNDQEIRNIIARMTLEEKTQLLTGRNSWRTTAYPQYGIPSLLMSDGTNGIRYQIGSGDAEPDTFGETRPGGFDTADALARTQAAVCYPSGSAMASTWNRDLLHSCGEALAKECRSLGIGMLLGPGMNIRRHPLTARNFEYYSEDPVLSGEMAAAVVSGLQENGVASSIKHFVCHNSDDRRTRVNVTVSERAFHEIYLAGFERAVRKGHPATIMTCYNSVNETEINENKHLLTDIVRGDWGFEGAFITDWGAVKNITAAVQAGVDLQMPHSETSRRELLQAVKDGRISEDLINEHVFRVIRLADTYHCRQQIPCAYEPLHEIATEAERQAIVMLRNENRTLPVSEDVRRIAVIGSLAEKPQIVGSGCAVVKAIRTDNPLACLRSYCKARGIELTYCEGYDEHDLQPDEAKKAEALAAAEAADLVLFFAGTYPAEEGDTFNHRDMSLPETQNQLIHDICACAPRTAVIVSAGEITLLPWAEETGAILETWYGGEGVGTALADIIFGVCSPSGHLSVTIPRREEDHPAYLNFTSDPYRIFYGEDIYVGYRYYDRKKTEPLYPFGHGLTYTTFAYSNPRILHAGSASVTIAADITNTGDYDAYETVQIYAEPLSSEFDRPVRELKDFGHYMIHRGETVTAEFTIPFRALYCYDQQNHEWVNDAPVYLLYFASSSRDLHCCCEIQVPITVHPVRTLRYDAGFHEIFADEATAELFFSFMRENGFLKEDADTAALTAQLEGTFWPIRVYLDMHSGGRITYAMTDDLIRRMNEALKTKYQ